MDGAKKKQPSAMDVAMMKVVLSRTKTVSPTYEHTNVWIAWVNGDHKTFISFNTNQRVPSILSVDYARKKAADKLCVFLNVQGDAEMPLRALWWCLRNEKVPFNNAAYWWNFVPYMPDIFKIKTDGKSYYCAEEVASLLSYLGVRGFTDCTPYTMTPDGVYEMLVRSGVAVATIVNTSTSYFAQTRVVGTRVFASGAGGGRAAGRSGRKEIPVSGAARAHASVREEEADGAPQTDACAAACFAADDSDQKAAPARDGRGITWTDYQ